MFAERSRRRTAWKKTFNVQRSTSNAQLQKIWRCSLRFATFADHRLSPRTEGSFLTVSLVGRCSRAYENTGRVPLPYLWIVHCSACSCSRSKQSNEQSTNRGAEHGPYFHRRASIGLPAILSRTIPRCVARVCDPRKSRSAESTARFSAIERWTLSVGR